MQKLDETFVAIDRFGVPVSVNYRGFKNYKTRCGACCSIGYYLIMIMTTFALLEPVFNYSETQIIVIDSPYDDEDWTDIRQSPHDLGVTMIWEANIATANGIVHEIPESIGRVVAYKPLPSQAADAKIQ